jgi:hypothetical protein
LVVWAGRCGGDGTSDEERGDGAVADRTEISTTDSRHPQLSSSAPALAPALHLRHHTTELLVKRAKNGFYHPFCPDEAPFFREVRKTLTMGLVVYSKYPA